MSNLTFLEKNKFEKLFRMSDGYVINFSNRTFTEFIGEVLGLDIYDVKYEYGSCSKANLLRGLWKTEPNYNIGKLLENLLEYWRTSAITEEIPHDITDENLYSECLKIVERLKSDSPIENIDAIKPNSDEKDFSILAKSIKESIEKNEPESALDRLHTFTVKYVRQLCDNHQVEYKKETPLHSLFGGYVKLIVKEGVIESSMTERILKSSISIL